MYKELTFLKQIGEGSFGRVYMARWRETTVAVKVPTMRMTHIRLLLVHDPGRYHDPGSLAHLLPLHRTQVLHRQTGDHLDDDDLPLDPCPSAGSPDPILNALQKVRDACQPSTSQHLLPCMQGGLVLIFEPSSTMPDQVQSAIVNASVPMWELVV